MGAVILRFNDQKKEGGAGLGLRSEGSSGLKAEVWARSN